MKIKKLKVKEEKFEINLVFYNFLKKITQAKLSDGHIQEFLRIYYSNINTELETLKDLFFAYSDEHIKRNDIAPVTTLIGSLTEDSLDIFLFALKLNLIKDILLQDAKITQTMKAEQLVGLHNLSTAYDTISVQVAYASRISGALLSLLFFEKLEKGKTNFISENMMDFLKGMVQAHKNLSKKGVESNQIFMLLFAESINQSIMSSAGASYEDRIKSVLIKMGLPADDIQKTHDENDSSTEFDFFFKYKNRTYGVGAKRTLRERYKQFIKTVHMTKLDVMIEVTLGIDLRENIANSIREHGVYIIVSDEEYDAKKYLQKIEGVFPASKLSLSLLETLG